MQRVTLDQLREGMFLVRDVRDRRGRVSARAGEAVTAQTIFNLRARGVQEVGIDERSVFPRMTPRDSFPSPVLDLAEDEMIDLFHLADSEHPMLQELRRLCILRRARQLRRRM